MRLLARNPSAGFRICELHFAGAGFMMEVEFPFDESRQSAVAWLLFGVFQGDFS